MIRSRLDSIRARLLAAAALWLTLTLLAAWWVIGGVLDRFVTERFDAEAAAIVETVIAGVEIAADGTPALARPPTDPRLSMPLSGHAWQLEADDGAGIARSPSLLDLRLAAPAGSYAGSPGVGPDGEALRVMRRPFTLPGGDQPLAVVVTVPQAEIDAALSRVRQPLALSLIVLGAGLAMASVLQVGWGLRTLDALGRDIRAIRAGRAERVPLPPVAELRPVAVEINALLDANRSVIGRAREHLGNLAHSLRTPLSALANILPDDHPGRALVDRMDRQITWQLRRARTAGTPRLLGHRTPVAPVMDDLLLVLRRTAATGGLSIEVTGEPSAHFAGERHDLEEMLGNLLENAVKYAATRVTVSVDRIEGMLKIGIEDDGPGIRDVDHAIALSRGGRLDEMGPPGAGLGLAIVADLAALYGGRLTLGQGMHGGLRAGLVLPG
ncbi:MULTISPECIES: ATP-binding protein [unclassified Paracoccus (in: a-proteobacteria)]|uniref:ATP-binding protein n=1 Tax=unclassified Paracoccus (in: a-proteobacteria) TaxID=2688777 RepID=UPI0016005ED7|nr:MULTISPECIES: ATP-binding protein [unclassified Paracoccus (in: a-proteobacteria)]MBB1492241.1 sensor histidine kinase [Paracoccus sp. MC1854]MBB1498677.1 sensor histidine kinase [Paracoccus sp. MC1862]QQO45635.1 sensor histidine kinase [Paracoccus sp. MC1862]